MRSQADLESSSKLLPSLMVLIGIAQNLCIPILRVRKFFNSFESANHWPERSKPSALVEDLCIPK